jgi:hypothetical protein
MNEQGFAQHNVVAAYAEADSARDAIDALRTAGIPESDISLLGRQDVKVHHEVQAHDAAADLPSDTARSVAGPAAAGTAAGGLAGFVAGAIAFGIPGIGPAVGAGIWAATAGGGVAGGTMGGVMGGIKRFFDERYRDAVTEGQVLVGVHSGDADTVSRAHAVLAEHGPHSINRFDSEGRVV